MTTHNHSIATLILSARRARRVTLAALLFSMASFAILYFIMIGPALAPATLTNLAVIEFIGSKDFRDRISPAFDSLEKYNKGESDSSALASDLYAVDPSQLGIVVEIHYRLTPQLEKYALGNDKRSDTPNTLYRYEPEISVRLSPFYLGMFILLETALICLFIFSTERKVAAQVKFEERELDDFFLNGTSAIVQLAETPVAAGAYVKSVLANFHAFCMQLNERHANRPGLEINDEYDVQDALHSLLRLIVKDIRAEDPVPSNAGASSRIDFLLYNEKIGIEVKMPRQGLKDKDLGEELLVDIARYSGHPNCSHLIFFVYDPGSFIKNPQALREYISRHEAGMKIDLVISPMLYETI